MIIEVDNLSVRYMIGDFKDLGLKDFVIKKITGNYHSKEFWAIQNVSFSLEKGDFLGIIGTNGAGKSTLLKTISGIMKPQKGYYKTDGKIAALLELGTGFDKDMTLRENIFIRGALLGYTEEFMKKMSDEILEFAELKQFENRTYKQLSSGMKSRLAFSISCLVEPDILILDEVLSVGDASFRKKSEKKLFEIINGGATTLLVSHSLSQIRRLCNKVLWLNKGQQIAFGETKEICDMYEKFLSDGKIKTPDSRKVITDVKTPENISEKIHYDVGFVACISNPYGSLLSNYALYKAIEAFGKSVVILDNILNIENHIIQNFAENNMKLGTVLELPSNTKSINDYFDSFLVGPGNAWEIHNSENQQNIGLLHLNFADISKRTVAYGVSYNNNDFKFAMPINKLKYSLLKQRFDYIGLCEDYAVNSTKNIFNADCEMIIDPVFLFDKTFYHEISVQSKFHENDEYILLCMENYSSKYRENLIKISEKLNLKLIVIIPSGISIDKKKKLKEFDNIIENPDVCDWVYYIENSKLIITDEFYCMALSIIYHKNFIGLKNHVNEDRFTLIVNQLGISNKITDNPAGLTDEIMITPDYESIDLKLIEYIKVGYKFIEKAFIFPRDTIREQKRNEAFKSFQSLKNLSMVNSKYTNMNKEFGYLLKMKTEIRNIQNKNNINYLDSIYRYYNLEKKIPEPSLYKYELNAHKYFANLDLQNYILFISVRDACGKYADKLISTSKLPLKVKPQSKNSCIIIADSGNIIYESTENNRILYNNFIKNENLYVTITSKNSDKNDISGCAEIIINNINYSMNIQGFNIVVYDKSNKCVIDSFNINTCKDQYLSINRRK